MTPSTTPETSRSGDQQKRSTAETRPEPWTNIHIPAEKPDMEYHRVVARLAIEKTAQGGSVIDIGAGHGNVLRLIRRASPTLELHAADVSDDCLRVLDETVSDLILHHISDHHEAISDLGRGEFDTGIMCHTLEHTLNPLEALRAALDLIKPGGSLVLAVPNPVCPLCFGWSAIRYDYANRGHLCCWDRAHWMNFLENIANVQVDLHTQDEVRVFPQRISRRVQPLKFLERHLAGVLPWWSHSHISVVRAPSLGPADDAR